MVNQQPNEIIEEQYDQSVFATNQSVLQAPPQPLLSKQQVEDRKRKRLLIGIAGGLLLLIIIVAMVTPKRRVVQVEPTPTPLPSPTPMQSEMRQQLGQLKEIIDASNPEDTLVSPPQVNMQVEF